MRGGERSWLAALLVAAGVCGAARAAPDPQPEPDRYQERAVVERGPLRVSVAVAPASPTLTDLVEIRLAVEHPARMRARLPALEKVVEGVLLDRILPGGPRPLPGGRLRREVTYRFEPLVPGEILVPELVFEVTDPQVEAQAQAPAASGGAGDGPGDEPGGVEEAGGAHELITDAFTLEVAPAASGTGASPADLRPPAPPQALRPEGMRPGWGVAAIVAGCLGAAAVLVVLLRGRRRRAAQAEAAVIPPRERARRRLEALLAAGLPLPPRVKAFFYDLTGIVRSYLEEEFRLPVTAETTEEFLGALPSRRLLSPPVESLLGEFLQEADLVKYAARQPREEVIQGAVDAARAVIEFHPEAPAPAAAGAAAASAGDAGSTGGAGA